jgi:hypothetical protein
LKFKCIGDVDCKCEYSQVLLEEVLSEDLKRTITQREFYDISQIEGMWACPDGCGYVGSHENYPWIECPVCVKQYCTKCNENWATHVDKTCEDVEKERARTKDPKHMAHEAMSLGKT